MQGSSIVVPSSLRTTLNPSYKIFLKSRKLKLLIMSPKTHSTLALTELIAVLNCSCSGVRCNPLNGVRNCGLNRYHRSA